MNPYLQLFIQLAPLWSLSLIAFIPLTAKVLNNNKELRAGVVTGIYALAIISSLFLFLVLGFSDQKAFHLYFDNYGSGACVLAAIASLISLTLFHFNSWIDKRQLTEILFFFCQALLGLYVLCLSQNLMTAFIGLETVSLIVYINLSVSRKDFFCLEAAIKYFVLSAFSGAIFLYGLSFLFGVTGTLDLNSFFLPNSEVLFYNRFFFLGLALVFIGLFFKLALFPFHFWLPDVYQGALTPMTAFMALALKSSLILFLGKLFALPFFEKSPHASVFLSGLAVASVLTVLFGSLMALNQIKIKRFIAFSSLAHSGYLMMLLFGILTSSSKDFSPLFYYLSVYIFLTGSLLFSFQSLEKQSSQPEFKDLRALFKNHTWFAFALSLFLLGLAGVPPSFGFFAKVGLFQILILSGNWWLLFWAFVGSAIGLYYYIKPITFMLGEDPISFSLKWSRLAKSFFVFVSLVSFFGAFFFGLFVY